MKRVRRKGEKKHAGHRKKRRHRKAADSVRKKTKKSRRRKKQLCGSEQGSSSGSGSSSSSGSSIPRRGEAIKAVERKVADAERAVDAARAEVDDIEARMVDVPANPAQSPQEDPATYRALEDNIAVARLESANAVRNESTQLEQNLKEQLERNIDELNKEFAEQLRDGRERIEADAAGALLDRERWFKEQAARQSEQSKISKERKAHADAMGRLEHEQLLLRETKQKLAALASADKHGAEKDGSGSEASNAKGGKSSESYSDYSGDDI